MKLLIAKSALFFKYLMDLTMGEGQIHMVASVIVSCYIDRPKLKLKNAKKDDYS